MKFCEVDDLTKSVAYTCDETVMGNSAVSKSSRRNLGELSGTSFGQRRYQSTLRDRSDADESGISTSPSCNHSSSYSPTRDLLTAEPAVRITYIITLSLKVSSFS